MSMMYAKVDTIMKHSELPTKSKLSTSSLPEEDSDPFPYEDEEDSLDVSGQKRVTFNVGGVIFETLESSLTQPKRIVAKLLDHRFLERHWDEERREYFFDRDPVAFQAVLNYLRTGVLHLPHNMCSPQITAELIYWGLPRIDIEPCCWKDYSIGIQSLENLRKLEHDRQPAYTNPANLAHRPKPQNWHQRLKIRVWNVVSDPSSSRVAKVYASVALMFVVVSICSFGLATVPEYSPNHNETHPGRELSEDQLLLLQLLQNVRDLSSFNIDSPNSFLLLVDLTCFVFFVLDLLLHLASAPVVGKLLRSYGCIVDLLSLVPDVSTLISISFVMKDPTAVKMSTLYVIRALGLMKFMRLFRVFRLAKRVTGVMIIFYTLWASIKELISLVTILLVTMLVFASFVFFAESETNPKFQSVFHGCWWSLITLTTVGYGDAVPTSVVGQFLGSICAVWGVLLLGITIPTMVTNFLTYHFLVRYIDERELIYLYRKHANYERLPNIPFPDFL